MKTLMRDRGVLASAFTMVLIAGCATESQKKGMEMLTAGNFQYAVQYLQEAVREKPDDEELQTSLLDAKQKLSRQFVTKSKEHSTTNLSERSLWLSKALELDPSNAEAVTEFTAIKDANAKLDEIILRVKNMLVADPIGARELYLTIDTYRRDVPRVQNAFDEVQASVRSHFENTFSNQLDKKQFSAASNSIKNYAKNGASAKNIQALEAALEAKKRILTKQWETALSTLEKGEVADPYNVIVKSLKREATDKLIKQLVAEGAANLKKNALEGKTAALAAYDRINQLSAANSESYELAKSGTQDAVRSIGQLLVKRAEELYDADRFKNAASALYLLQMAYRFNPELVDSKIEKGVFLQAVVEEKAKLNIALHVQNESKIKSDYADIIVDSVGSEIDHNASQGFRLVHREALKDVVLNEEALAQGYSTRATRGVDLETADVTLLIKVLRDDFSMRTSTRDVPSLYVSGSQDIPNPAYAKAKGEVDSAKRQLEMIRQQESRRRTQASQQSYAYAYGNTSYAQQMSAINAISDTVGDVGIAVFQENVSNAEQKLFQTPKYLQQDIVSGYSFKVITTIAGSDVRLSYKLIDQSSGIQSKTETIDETTELKADRTDGVRATDRKGYREVYAREPSEYEARESAQSKATNRMKKGVITALEDLQWRRFCESGSKKMARRGVNDAVEQLAMCLRVASPDNHQQIENAQDALLKFVGLSESLLAKYAGEAINKKDGWPYGAAELSDSEKKHVHRIVISDK